MAQDMREIDEQRALAPNTPADGSDEARQPVELVRRIGQDVQVLVKDELALAKLEVADSLKRASIDLVAVTLGGVLGLIGLGLLCVTAVVALRPVLAALWLRMLLMSGVYLCLSSLLAGVFLGQLRKLPLAPPRAAREAKQTLRGVVEHARQD